MIFERARVVAQIPDKFTTITMCRRTAIAAAAAAAAAIINNASTDARTDLSAGKMHCTCEAIRWTDGRTIGI